METFSALLAICAGNSPVPGEFPAQRPVTRSFHVFFDLRLNKPLSKQSWGWWFETLSRPLWRHCSVFDDRANTCYRPRGWGVFLRNWWWRVLSAASVFYFHWLRTFMSKNSRACMSLCLGCFVTCTTSKDFPYFKAIIGYRPAFICHQLLSKLEKIFSYNLFLPLRFL